MFDKPQLMKPFRSTLFWNFNVPTSTEYHATAEEATSRVAQIVDMAGGGVLAVLLETHPTYAKYVGKLITVDGPKNGYHDSSWKGGIYKVIGVYEDESLQVIEIRSKSIDGEMMFPPIHKDPFRIDTNMFIVRILTPEGVLELVSSALRDFDDMNRRFRHKEGYIMKNGEPKCGIIDSNAMSLAIVRIDTTFNSRKGL